MRQEYEYVIYGRAPGIEKEKIDMAEGEKELSFLLKEYRTAYGPEWSLTYKRRVKE